MKHYLEWFVILYTLRQVWNHGHHAEMWLLIPAAFLLDKAVKWIDRRFKWPTSR